MRRLSACLLLSALALPAIAGPVRHVTGEATDLRTGQAIYREEHTQRHDGARWLSGSIRYIATDGRLLGEKSLDFSQDPYVPVMRFTQTATGSEDQITRVDADGIHLLSRYQGKTSRVRLPREPGQVADAGFDTYVADHLPALARGQSVDLKFIVVARQAQYSFRIVPAGRLEVAGEPALRLRVEPASLLRWLVDPLTLVYGLQTRRLLQYDGVSNVTNPRTGKVWEARIRFDTAAPGKPRG